MCVCWESEKRRGEGGGIGRQVSHHMGDVWRGMGEGGGVASYRAVSMRARRIHLILCRINRVGKGNVHFYYFDSNVPRDMGMKMKYNET